MAERYDSEPMLALFIFETTQLIEQLEQIVLSCEKGGYDSGNVDEIFRIMHTIKGSSAMMLFNNISKLAHAIEDLFYYIREGKTMKMEYSSISDLLLECIDFIKVELEKIKNGDNVDGDSSIQIENIRTCLDTLKRDNPSLSDKGEREKSEEKKQYYIRQEKSMNFSYRNGYKATIFFTEDCEMENIRAYTIIHNLKDITEDFNCIPENLVDGEESIDTIRREGFKIWLRTDCSYEEMYQFFQQTLFLKSCELEKLEDSHETNQIPEGKKNIDLNPPVVVSKLSQRNDTQDIKKEIHGGHQSIISVSISKLDSLMDLVGEMVIAEAMVTQNPDLKGLELANFHKASRQLHKITSELQDMVMSIRMVPLSGTFQKMQRIVRDMSRKLDKEVKLDIIGEETEVDKNIIEHISDPLMHLVRNAIDHGIEEPSVRAAGGKPQTGTVTLEAKNEGGSVLVIIRDDGKGLNKERILEKGRSNGLLTKAESEMTDKEIYNLIFLPGFSTKDKITEFSGRGVGMDVVTKNIEAIGGAVSIDSIDGVSTTVTLKIPLTLAIIDGMNVMVGNSNYTIPTTIIKESFKPLKKDLVRDPDGNEMIMVRGQCYPIIRLHESYGVETQITDLTEGILIMVENEKTVGLFADRLIGQQQVVVKALPKYIKNTRKIHGLAGCTLLGDGSISLILDIGGLLS